MQADWETSTALRARYCQLQVYCQKLTGLLHGEANCKKNKGEDAINATSDTINMSRRYGYVLGVA